MLPSLPFVPVDRQVESAHGARLPDRGHGAALFADISGFTAMTEALVAHYGPLRGAERLGVQLEAIYTPLIAQVHARRGAVIGFSGDAITCWFAEASGERPEQRAVAAARAMQTAMEAFAELRIGSRAVTLAVKVAVTSGPARRFVVGDPAIQRIDALAGETLVRLAAAEQLAEPGDVLVDEATCAALEGARCGAWREGENVRVMPVLGLDGDDPVDPWDVDEAALDPAWVRSWAHAPIADRYEAGVEFSADFRPAAALFLSFGGIDYDADDAAGERLDAFVRRVQARLEEYGGSLIQLTIGDKGSYLYAAFGAPVAVDREAERAVEAARVLLRESAGGVEDVRIGLTHGRMFAGAYGSATRQTYGVLGPKTNLSARFMKKAPAGTILCDDAIVRGARRRWTFREGAPLQLKGIAEPVTPFVPEERRGDAATDAGGPAALVGRDDDLRAVEDAIGASESGAFRALAVEGEAGIGKSRLLETAVAKAQARGLHVHRGAGRSEARGVPYAAWRDVVASLLRVDPAAAAIDDAAAAQARAAIERRVAELAPDETRWVPLLDDILDIGLAESDLTQDLDPGLRRDNLRQLVVALLQAEAADAPLVVFLDDAHWFDSVSWELTRDVARALREAGAHASLLFGHRPLEDGNLALEPLRALAQADGLETHALGPLGDDGLALLVAERLEVARESVPDELRRLVVERAGGNPLFAEELLESLRETGALRTDTVDGARRVVFEPAGGEDASGGLPPTLHGLVLMRLDRLPSKRQRVLKVASAVGRLFGERPLAASLDALRPGATEALPEDLGALVERNMIVHESQTPESTFLFRHVLTHEAVYESLLFAQRRRIHRILGEWFESAYADRLEGVESTLSTHFLRAADGSDDPELLEKAVRYTRAAGGRNDRLGAYPEAIAAFRAALRLLHPAEDHPRLRSELLVALAETLERTGDFEEAAEHLAEALDLADSAGIDRTVATAYSVAALVATRQGDFERAREAAESSLERSLHVRDELAQSNAHSRLGMLAFYRGDLDGAKDHFQKSLELGQRAGDRHVLPGLLNSLGLAYLYAGDPVVARHRFEEGIAIARETGDRNATSHMLSNLGLIAESDEEFERARDLYREALDLQLELGARQGATLSILNLGDASASLDLVDDARGHYRSGLERAMQLNAVPLALIALRGFAWCEQAEGRHERAAELLGHVLGHPACSSELEGQANDVLDKVRSDLPPADVDASMERGAAADFVAVVAEMLHAQAQPVGSS